MTFPLLAVICAVALLGPLLAVPRRWRVPVVVGELLAGILVGRSGMNLVDPDEPSFAFLADVGFALVMFVAGSHVPLRDASLKPTLTQAAFRQAAVIVLAAIAGIGVAALFGTGQAPLYAVLMASSSAAMVLPMVASLGLRGQSVVATMAQVAMADTLAIVALPFAMDRSSAGPAALGAITVLAGAAVVYFVLLEGERRSVQQRLHRVSEQRKFALELRLQLVVLFALAGLAVWGHVSVMLAGFSFGLAVAAVGEPRRLARQLFAITDGFLGPLFFVWLGASLQLQALSEHPEKIALGLVLGLGALAVHASMRLLGQELPLGLLAASQLGVPVAAATIGIQQGLLEPGEPAALILGALVTIAVATAAAGRYGAHGGRTGVKT